MVNRLVAMLSRLAVILLGTVATISVEAGDPGMTIVAMGGGSLDDATFKPSNPETADATFSLFAGKDKHGDFKGHFQFKRVYPGSGVRAVVSTEITDLVIDPDSYDCPWVRMAGDMTHHANWAKKPIRGEHFAVEVWDCEDLTGVPDMIQIWVYKEDFSPRGALTLVAPTAISGGEIIIK